MKVKSNPKEMKEKEAGKSPMSARECLEKVEFLFMANGFKVDQLNPTRREHNTASFSRPNQYISPIEFNVNGMNVALYGNRLVIDNSVDQTHANIWDVPLTYKYLANKLNNSRKQEKTVAVKKPSKQTFTARYFAASLA